MSSPQSSGRPRPSVRRFGKMKREGERIVCLTAYDFTFARLVERAGVDFILVGDSLGQVVLGYDSTVPVTMDEMIHHAKAVKRGAPSTFIVVDLPFLAYQTTVADALFNAGRVLKESGAHAVKLEGGGPAELRTIEALVQAGIPVMGHLGLTPQAVHRIGGHRVQGRVAEERERLLTEAAALETAGCFGMVLELIPADLASEVTSSVGIPTIGIGAGAACDGQVLVVYDALGLNADFRPRFLKRFAELDGEVTDGLQQFVNEVRAGQYPGPEHSF